MPVAEQQTPTRSGSRVTLLLAGIIGFAISAVVALVVQYATVCLLPVRTPHTAGSGDRVPVRR